MTQNPHRRKEDPRWQRLHRYYQHRGHYRFVGRGLLRLIGAILILGILIALFNRFVFDVEAELQALFAGLSDNTIRLMFLASESFLGLVPIDVFIAWGSSVPDPFREIVILSLISYLGGIISFFEGRTLIKLAPLRDWLARKYAKQWRQFLKFGWLVVSISAMTPIPFAPVSLMAGGLGLSFKVFLLAALARFIRFAIYGWFFFSVFS